MTYTDQPQGFAFAALLPVAAALIGLGSAAINKSSAEKISSAQITTANIAAQTEKRKQENMQIAIIGGLGVTALIGIGFLLKG